MGEEAGWRVQRRGEGKGMKLLVMGAEERILLVMVIWHDES
jgi:hypothetical protein